MSSPDGTPSHSSRTALTVSVTGLTSAKACSQSGIESTGTKADDAKVSGNSQMKPADWATSALGTESPISAAIHENANPNRSSSSTPATILATSVSWNENPTMK